jgi:CheY-like chemotaxis protein
MLTSPMSSSEPCVLLVDDDPDGREMMATLLELNRHHVTPTSSTN